MNGKLIGMTLKANSGILPPWLAITVRFHCGALTILRISNLNGGIQLQAHQNVVQSRVPNKLIGVEK